LISEGKMATIYRWGG